MMMYQMSGGGGGNSAKAEVVHQTQPKKSKSHRKGHHHQPDAEKPFTDLQVTSQVDPPNSTGHSRPPTPPGERSSTLFVFCKNIFLDNIFFNTLFEQLMTCLLLCRRTPIPEVFHEGWSTWPSSISWRSGRRWSCWRRLPAGRPTTSTGWSTPPAKVSTLLWKVSESVTESLISKYFIIIINIFINTSLYYTRQRLLHSTVLRPRSPLWHWPLRQLPQRGGEHSPATALQLLLLSLSGTAFLFFFSFNLVLLNLSNLSPWSI